MKPSCRFVRPSLLPLVMACLVLIVVMGTLQIRAAGENVDMSVNFVLKADSSLTVTKLHLEPELTDLLLLLLFFKREERTEEKAWEFDCTFSFP